jgi:ATP-dependent Clp protease ATP-binding subunit ClpB
MARAILSGDIHDGDTVLVDRAAHGDGLVVIAGEAARAAANAARGVSEPLTDEPEIVDAELVED